jgi:nucleoid-associated protein YgaU
MATMKLTPLPVFTGLAAAAAATFGVLFYESGGDMMPPEGGNISASQESSVTAAPAPQPLAQTGQTAAAVETPAAEPPAAPAAGQAAAPAEVVASAPATAPETQAPAPAVEAPAVAEAPLLPSFDTVRVEPTGEAVIAGRARPGAEVAVKLNGTVIGTATANAEGSFVLVPAQPLAAGAGALSLEVSEGGQVLASADAVAIAVKPGGQGDAVVAKIQPGQPTEVVQAPQAAAPAGAAAPSAIVTLDAVDYDSAGNIVFSGRARPGTTVRLYVDNAAAGEAPASSEGHWRFDGTSPIPPGTHTLRADEVTADGSVTSRIEVPFFREKADDVAAGTTAAENTATEVADSAATPPAETPEGQASAPATASEAPATGDPAAATAAATPTEPAETRIVIQPGNNLWKLSRQIYGKGIQYTVIFEANKDQIRDPGLIYPGQVFVAPAAKQ